MQDKADQVPLEYLKVTHEHDHGRKMEDEYEWVEEKALGAASLAQVHKAKLRETGDIVAVKI